MITKHRLLAQGLLPKEAPPCFTTDLYAHVAETTPLTAFTHPGRVALASHSLARTAGVRRSLAIPNPLPFNKLAAAITNNWKDIEQHLQKSTITISRPTPGASGNRMKRAAQPLIPYRDLPRVRVHARKHGKYLLQADIAEFYGTAYTHSIPWALHGKAQAKKKKKSSQLSGNEIDVAVRNCQDQQTNGIPIGPDTSFIIGEVILAAIDTALEERSNYLVGFRYYDDFELTFEERRYAEEAPAILHDLLAEYNLKLNSQKTNILELPQPMDTSWRHQLRKHSFDPKTRRTMENALIGYFDLAFYLKQQNPDDPVISYAIARLSSIKFTTASWRLTQDLLFQALTSEPASTPKIAVFLAEAHVNGESIDQDDLATALSCTIKEHAPLNHGSETAWALWLALALNCKLEDSTTLAALSKTTDALTAILALDAHHRGLLPDLDVSKWASMMTTDELYGSHWLLSYEARVQGWLPSAGAGAAGKHDHITDDSGFNHLQQHGVRFYEPVHEPTQNWLALIPSWRDEYGA